MNRKLIVTLMALAVTCFARSEAQAIPRHVTPASLNENARQVFEESMALDAKFWDEGCKLVRYPQSGPEGLQAGDHMVRESSWYALGLLLRDEPGDRKRAADILDAVLKHQYVAPGTPWYGTYKRAPEEPDPTPASIMWHQFDPNWRVFIGSTFAMILIEYPDRISPELAQRMYTAIDRSIEGEIAEKRLVPSYTNISLMYGFLWDFAAAHDKRADWQKQSREWNLSVYSLFKRYGTFFEYNSPTYSGADLYDLALWRSYGSTAGMRTMGSEMEAGLWRDIASLYQPELRNISGPYDRAYGMDMESYVSVVGIWLRSTLRAQRAPLPPISGATNHVGDIWLTPHVAILGARVPEDALAKITQFEGEHLVRRQISSDRVATAWIGKDVIFGGEATNKTRDVGPTSQFHPATIQWRTPSGEIGWVQLVQAPMIDATADERGLTISTTGAITVRIHAKGLDQTKIGSTSWELPGLKVAVSSDAKSFSIEKVDDSVDLVYSGITGIRWDVQPVR
jgi:hypothetical protein